MNVAASSSHAHIATIAAVAIFIAANGLLGCHVGFESEPLACAGDPCRSGDDTTTSDTDTDTDTVLDTGSTADTDAVDVTDTADEPTDTCSVMACGRCLDDLDTPDCDPDDPALVACYTFDADEVADDGTLLVRDGSAHGNHGTGRGVFRVTETDPAGATRETLGFDGVSLVEVPFSESLVIGPQMTTEAWVRFDALPVDGNARVAVFDSTLAYSFFVYGQEIRCNAGSNGYVWGGHVEVGIWTHLMCAFDGQTLRLFQDGVEVGAIAAGPGDSSTFESLLLGANSPDENEHLTGALDRVRIWRRALSDEERCLAQRP